MDTPEAKTRKNLIDPGFRKAGWNLEDLTQVVQEFPIPFKTDTKKIPNVTLSILQRMYDNRYVKFIQFIKYILGMEKTILLVKLWQKNLKILYAIITI